MIEAILVLLALFWQILHTEPPVEPETPAPVYANIITGKATWYEAGAVTACGNPYDPDGLTIALVDFSRALCGTEARVEWDGKVVYATITDHMPDNDRGRVADLSRGTKNALGCPDVAHVTISY